MIPIRRRLARILFLTVGILAVISAVSVFTAMRIIVLARFDETLTAKAQALITASEIDDEEFEIDLTVQDFAGFGSSGDDYFEIFRHNGDSFLRSPSLQGVQGSLSAWRQTIPPSDGNPKLENGTLELGVPVRVYLQRFQPKDDEFADYNDLYIVVASPIRSLRFQLAILGIVLSTVVAAALVIMVPAIGFGLKRGLEPLETLSLRLGELNLGQLDHRLDPEALPDELRPIAQNLNSWLKRLEESFERERRFSSNAAHELRTPLAELKSISQMGAKWKDAATQERFRETCEVADEMKVILDKLALLSQADAKQLPLTRESIRPRETIDQILERNSFIIKEKRLKIRHQTEQEFINTDIVIFVTICRNLIDNAVNYSPEGAVIDIDLQEDRLTVGNDAPNLRDSDLDRIFDRFWRHDDSRTGSGHSGLGLSIVKACADLLGGDCKAHLSRQRRLKISVVVAIQGKIVLHP